MAFIVFVYDFDDSKWKEAEQLFLHDIALLLDKDKKDAYFWAGNRAKLDEKEIAFGKASSMMDRFKSYNFIALEDSVIPLKVQQEVELLLGDNTDPSKTKIIRSNVMKAYMIFGILSIIATLTLYIQSLTILGWDQLEYYVVSVVEFNDAFEITAIIGFTAASLYFIQLIFGSVTKKLFLVVCSLTSFAILVGTFLYIGEGEIIFVLDANIEAGFYYITRSSMNWHIVWLTISLLTSSASAVLGILVVLKQSRPADKEEVDIEEIQMKSRPSILRDKKKNIEQIPAPQ